MKMSELGEDVSLELNCKCNDLQVHEFDRNSFDYTEFSEGIG